MDILVPCCPRYNYRGILFAGTKIQLVNTEVKNIKAGLMKDVVSHENKGTIYECNSQSEKKKHAKILLTGLLN